MQKVQRGTGWRLNQLYQLRPRRERTGTRRTDEEVLGSNWIRLPSLLQLALVANLLIRRSGCVNAHGDTFPQRDEVRVARQKHETARSDEPRLILFGGKPAVYPHH